MIPKVWLVVGLAGQVVFAARFVVQWIASERRKESFVPKAFWFLSIFGGLTLLSYAIYRRDPVFILGHLSGVLVYSRNLWLVYHPRPGDATPS